MRRAVRREPRTLAGYAVAVALLSAACSGSSTVPTAPTGPPAPALPPPPRIARTRYLAFGDSLTAGTTSPAVFTTMSAGLPESYPYKLLSLLAARYSADTITIENEGKPGELASVGVQRLPTLAGLNPEVVILIHGANDIALLGTGGVARTADFVATMVRAARVAGADVVLGTLPPQRPGGSRAADPAALNAYNEAIRAVANEEGAMLIDFERNVDVRLIGEDGLHPTESGYARMAQLLFEAIRARFELAP